MEQPGDSTRLGLKPTLMDGRRRSLSAVGSSVGVGIWRSPVAVAHVAGVWAPPKDGGPLAVMQRGPAAVVP